MAIEIRPPVAEAEIRAAYALIRALAVHHDMLDAFRVSEEAFVTAASSDSADIYILLAVEGETALGVCTYTERYHIWNDSRLIELDDLYVTDAARGRGIGTGLLKAIGEIAKARSIPVKWQVEQHNDGAIALYQRMGASVRPSGICFWRPEDV